MTATTLLRLAFAGLALFALPAAASTFLVTDDELEPDLFPAVAESIRANLDQVGLSSAKRTQVLRLLDRMEGHIADDPIRHHSRVRQDQRRLNAALAPELTPTHRRAEVVCQQIRPVGSKIPVTRCRDRQTIEDEHHEAQRLATKPRICRVGGGGGNC